MTTLGIAIAWVGMIFASGVALYCMNRNKQLKMDNASLSGTVDRLRQKIQGKTKQLHVLELTHEELQTEHHTLHSSIADIEESLKEEGAIKLFNAEVSAALDIVNAKRHTRFNECLDIAWKLKGSVKHNPKAYAA